MKRSFVVSTSLLALLSAGLLTSCGGEKKAASGATTEKSNEPVKVSLWYGAAVTEAGAPPADWNVLQIVKDKLNIDLELTMLPSSESDQIAKVNAAAAANSLGDLVFIQDANYTKLVDQGLLAPVDDMYAMMPNRTKLLYDDASKKYTTYKGHSFAFAQPGSIQKNEGILIRKDWLDKLGLAVPVTTDDFLNVMKAFTEQDPDGNGKNDTYGYGAYLELSATNEGLGRRLDPLTGAFGTVGTWSLEADSVGLNVNRPEYFEALSWVKEIIDAGAIDPNWLTYKKDDFRAAWKQGRFGIMREQNAAFAAENNYKPFDQNFPEGEWIVIDPPKGPNGKMSVGTNMVGYRMYAVSAKAAAAGKKEAIAKLLEWMSSDEGYYLLGFGVEGVNYILKDGVPVVDGLPDASKGYTQPEIQPITQLRNMVFYNGDAELASRYPTYTAAKSGKTMSALTTLREMQKHEWTSQTGVNGMPKPSADVERFLNQGISEFMTGKQALTKENWDKWVENFNKMGGKDWNDQGVKYAQENNLVH